jgi:hypothetical protein
MNHLASNSRSRRIALNVTDGRRDFSFDNRSVWAPNWQPARVTRKVGFEQAPFSEPQCHHRFAVLLSSTLVFIFHIPSK